MALALGEKDKAAKMLQALQDNYPDAPQMTAVEVLLAQTQN